MAIIISQSRPCFLVQRLKFNMTVEVKSPDTQMSENSVGEVIKVVDEKKAEGVGAGEEKKNEIVEKTDGVDVSVVAERGAALEKKLDDAADEKKIEGEGVGAEEERKNENVEKIDGVDVSVVPEREAESLDDAVDEKKTEGVGVGGKEERRNENVEKTVGAENFDDAVDEKKTKGEGVGAEEERKSENVEKTVGFDVLVVAEREVVLENKLDDGVDEKKSVHGDAEETIVVDAPVVVDREVDVEKKIDVVDEKNGGDDGKAVEEKEVDVEVKTEIGASKAVEEREVEVEVDVDERPEGGIVKPVPEKELEKRTEGGDEKKIEIVERNEGETAASSTEESRISADMTDVEKKALTELRMKVEEAILQNKICKKEKPTQDGEEDKDRSVRKGRRTREVDDELKDPTEDKSVEEVKNPIEEKSKEVMVDDGVNKDISLWGVPLLPSKGVQRTDVLLLKFLRARDFKVNEAFEMLTNTLQWRKEYKCDSLLDEEFSADLNSVAYIDGVDSEGHPICFNLYGPFQNDELYQKTLGEEDHRQELLRWRVQLMERSIQKLDFSPGCVSSLLQINDLHNAPGLSKTELRVAAKQAVTLLQDNYPEFVTRNIFINVPFWFYAFYALLSPFLSQRTKSKIVFARPSNVTDTLLRYIPANEVPTKYGGLKRDNETEFSSEKVFEISLRAVSTELIEIPATKVGTTLLWDLNVLGWEVTYKEEFVPSDEKSYTLIVSKSKRVGLSDQPIRNSFTNKEPGKIVITIENGAFKKKRAFYRYKTTQSSS